MGNKPSVPSPSIDLSGLTKETSDKVRSFIAMCSKVLSDEDNKILTELVRDLILLSMRLIEVGGLGLILLKDIVRPVGTSDEIFRRVQLESLGHLATLCDSTWIDNIINQININSGNLDVLLNSGKYKWRRCFANISYLFTMIAGVTTVFTIIASVICIPFTGPLAAVTIGGAIAILFGALTFVFAGINSSYSEDVKLIDDISRKIPDLKIMDPVKLDILQTRFTLRMHNIGATLPTPGSASFVKLEQAFTRIEFAGIALRNSAMLKKVGV